MTKAEMVKDAALQRVGCPYVYGGTGKICSPSYREARMNQYPDYADKIRRNCPRLMGTAKNCISCKWCDPETQKGKPCYDCAQFALACLTVVGIPLVSGANSQWLKTQFSDKGTIDSFPRDKVCLVFRKESDGRMHHVGVYCADGTVAHAKGHDYGVVRQSIDDVTFTHWGIPSGLYDDKMPTLRKGNSGEYVRILQQALKDSGYDLTVDGKFGAKTEDALKDYQKKHGLYVDGVCGPKTWESLNVQQPEPDNPDWVDDPPQDDPESAVTVDRESLVDMINQLEAMRDQLDGLAYVARGWIT